MDSLRLCKVCGIEKPLDDFYANIKKGGKTYWRRTCKVCQDARHKAWARSPAGRLYELKRCKAYYARKKSTEAGRLALDVYRKAYYLKNRERMLAQQRAKRRNKAGELTLPRTPARYEIRRVFCGPGFILVVPTDVTLG